MKILCWNVNDNIFLFTITIKNTNQTKHTKNTYIKFTLYLTFTINIANI